MLWFARQIRARNQMFSLSGTLASMANGLCYAIAAQIAYPDRQVVAFVGDGGFSMLMAELATAVKYKLPIKVVIIKNNTLGQITSNPSTSHCSPRPAGRPASPSRIRPSARAPWDEPSKPPGPWSSRPSSIRTPHRCPHG
jgi:thiamine pyrophosphate-dependent acetolactate synthase large subunit-like protein